MEIHESARRHGISDKDIRHAIDHRGYLANIDDDAVLYLGPDKASNLLEIIVIERENASDLVIHAMKARRKYEMLLGGGR